VSSANKTGSETEFILRGRSFIYTMNNRGPRNDPWEIPFFKVPQSEEKILVVLDGFTPTFCLLLDKEDLNQPSDTPQIPYKCNLAKKFHYLWHQEPIYILKTTVLVPHTSC